MIVATAGHVDHGKTTLLRALTGMDTDRLPEEKARGISIDLGFAHWDLPGGRTIGFVDVPGHQKFIRNMLCGVCAIDHVLLVIAADDGVMPQTREHLRIIDLLGVNRGTVAITKIDRVPRERVDELVKDVRALLRGTALADADTIALSALTGEGMDRLRVRLEAEAASQRVKSDDQTHWPRYIIDRVFTVAGSGTVVTGTVIAGAFAADDRVVVSPAGTQVRTRKLQQHGKPVVRVRSGERCAINLAQVEHTALGRGDWLVAPQAHAPTDRMDVGLRLLEGNPPLRHGVPVHVHIGAADVLARISWARAATISPGEGIWAQLRLDRPVNACHGDRLILRDQSAMHTLGGGVVLDPSPPLRRTPLQRASTLEALGRATPAESLAALIDAADSGLDLQWFGRVFNLREERVRELLPSGTQVFAAEGAVAFSSAWMDSLRQRLVNALDRYHRTHPGETWAESALLQREIAGRLDPAVVAAMLKRFGADNVIVMQGTKLRLPTHGASDNPREALLWQKMLPILEIAGVQIPSVRDLASTCSTPLAVMRDFVQRKAAAGQLVKITPERFALPRTLACVGAQARTLAAASPGGLFTAAQYRDVIGTGRGLAIEILECLDKAGTTHRKGLQRFCPEPNAASGAPTQKDET